MTDDYEQEFGDDEPPEKFHHYKLAPDGRDLLAHFVGQARQCISPIEYGSVGQGDAQTLEQMPQIEWTEGVEECGAIDTRRIFAGDDLAVEDPGWRCPTCRGSTFQYVGLYTLTEQLLDSGGEE
jgi:hypothetical protein